MAIAPRVDDKGRPVGPWGTNPTGSLKQSIQMFNAKADDIDKKSNRNKFPQSDDRPKKLASSSMTDTFEKQNGRVKDETYEYGRPEKGSKSKRRGIAAAQYVFREIIFLCEIISKYGEGQNDGTTTIQFGMLFHLYCTYSESLVGILRRARKYGLVHFEGEMLYQRQDDKVIVTLLKSMEDIYQNFQQSGDPMRCVAQKPSL